MGGLDGPPLPICDGQGKPQGHLDGYPIPLWHLGGDYGSLPNRDALSDLRLEIHGTAPMA